jgi:tetratricopeptide (TPR) repeat protein
VRLLAADIDSARALIDEGKVVEALKQIEALEKESSRNPKLQLQLGEMLQELAASRAERLQRLAPNSPQAHELLGKSYEAHQKLAEALGEYTRAVEKSPQLPGLHFLIGNVYWKLGELDQAKSALEQELKLNPNHTLASLRLGQVLLRMDETAPLKAIPYLQRALSDPQASLQAHRELGKAFRLAGRQQEALHELMLVAERIPDDNMIHAQLAAVYRAMGDAGAARHEMELHSRILQQEHKRAVTGRQQAGPSQ